MNNPIIQDIIDDDYIMNIYAYMKSKHGNDIVILFHVGNFFEAYMSDSTIVADVLRIPRILLEKHMEYVVYVARFRESRLEWSINELSSAGHGIVISEMVGEDGKYKLDIYE